MVINVSQFYLNVVVDKFDEDDHAAKPLTGLKRNSIV